MVLAWTNSYFRFSVRTMLFNHYFCTFSCLDLCLLSGKKETTEMFHMLILISILMLVKQNPVSWLPLKQRVLYVFAGQTLSTKGFIAVFVNKISPY